MPSTAGKLILCMVLTIAIAAMVGAPAYAATTPSTYVVQKGDTLYAIAKKAGLSVDEIAQLNNLRDPNAIKPGMELLLQASPSKSGTSSSTTTQDKSPTPQAKTYTVQPGDSLWAISKRTGVSLADILSYNGLREDSLIRSGQVLRLSPPASTAVPVADAPKTITATPARTPEAAVQVPALPVPQPLMVSPIGGVVVPLPLPVLDGKATTPGSDSKAQPNADKDKIDPQWATSLRQSTGITEADIAPSRTTSGTAGSNDMIPNVVATNAERAREVIGRLKGDLDNGQLIWPVTGRVTSQYGRRWGRMHEGLDIAVPTGTPVRVVADGVVTFAGSSGGYGNLVIVNHGLGWETYYAHNSELRVQVGDMVLRNQVIARSGSTGNSTGPHVHFEVRKNGEPLDPLKYLK